jgi:bifunctional non-homologous end joining protein LigD
VKPVKVAEIEFTEWTADGHIRHPSLQGFRSDKDPRDVHREKEAHIGGKQASRATNAIQSNVKPDSPVVYPRIRFTRSDLAQLYSEIADWALPHVERRPLTLVRGMAPITRADALRSQAKFVHHTTRDQRFVPDTVPRVQISEKKKVGEYCYIDSRDALIALIESGVVELHTWNARTDNVERPDRVVFDIDPGDNVPWRDVSGAARRLRKLLHARDLESWVKTTGGKGLHVVVPFRSEHDWDAVFEFSRRVASELTQESARYTLSFEKSARRGKILIDYKRNYRTSIAVAAFSTRAAPDGAMSVPLAWDELTRIKASDAWTVQNIRDRLRRAKADPWRDYFKSRQRLVL